MIVPWWLYANRQRERQMHWPWSKNGDITKYLAFACENKSILGFILTADDLLYQVGSINFKEGELWQCSTYHGLSHNHRFLIRFVINQNYISKVISECGSFKGCSLDLPDGWCYNKLTDLTIVHQPKPASLGVGGGGDVFFLKHRCFRVFLLSFRKKKTQSL